MTFDDVASFLKLSDLKSCLTCAPQENIIVHIVLRSGGKSETEML